MQSFKNSLIELITRTSTELPPDVRAAVRQAQAHETPETQSASALKIIAANIDMAAGSAGPICQDTGMPTFEIRAPAGISQLQLDADIRAAVAEATRRGTLRPNAVDPISGENSGDNLGPGMPVLHWRQWENDNEIEVRLLLKGGGCENKNSQYALPCELPHLGRAERTLDGVRKCILHAVWQAQGQGCSAGALGVCIGGDRATGYEHAKAQLFRTLDDHNPDPTLAGLEQYILQAANTLGIGTMGFGGRVTLLGCKIGKLNRIPASFFVSIAYNCWAFRRCGVVLDARSGAIRRWLYQGDENQIDKNQSGKNPPQARAATEHFIRTGHEIPLRTPLDAATVRKLRVGDIVLVSGEMFTARDAVHAHLMQHAAPVDLQGGVLFHSGPVALQQDGGWTITAAGPTTSIRTEPFQADIIRRYGIRAIVGKGGMGPRTLAGLQEYGAVYLNAIGGAAQYYARCIERIENVHLLEFGIPEALWHLHVRDFPAIVTMDAHGHSLHADVERASALLLEKLAAPVYP